MTQAFSGFVNVRREAQALQRAESAAQIEDLARAAFGAAARLLAHERIASGRFNTTYRVELAGQGALILRLAPPRDAPLFRHEARLLEREAGVQAQLASVGAQIPRLLQADFSQRRIDRDYVWQNCLPGELWEDLRARGDLSAADETRLWQQFGALVQRIHALQPADGRYGLPQPLAARASLADWYDENLAGMLQDCHELGIAVAGTDEWRASVAAQRALFEQAGSPRLVHGDLWLRNILVAFHPANAAGPIITGILDAERAFWGEPGAEWIFSFFELPPAFWQAYGRDLSPPHLDAAALFRRRAYQARGALQLILEARRFGFDPGFAHRNLAQAVAALSRNDGRRSTVEPSNA